MTSNGLPNKKSSVRIVGLLLSAFLILLLLCALCLPLFFSTDAGKKILIKMIRNRTGVHIEIQELSLSWFGPQNAKEILIQKREELQFTTQEIKTDSPLWKILFLDHFGQLQVIAPNLQISKPFLPTAHLKRQGMEQVALLKKQDLREKQRRDFSFKGGVVVKEGKIVFNSPGLEPLAFDQIALSLNLTSHQELALALNCTTSMQGQIAIKGSASHLKTPFPAVAVQSTINQLPVRGIDQLISLIYPELSGLIYHFLGPTINLGCTVNASSGNVDLRFNAISPQISAYIATQSLNGTLSLKGPAELSFNLTPTFLQKLAKLYSTLDHPVLMAPVRFQATLEQFSCPLPSSVRDLLKSSFQVKLVASPQIPLKVDDQLVSLTDLSIHANSPSLEQQFSATLSMGLETGRQTGSLAIEGQVQMLQNGTLSLRAQRIPVDLIYPFSPLSPYLGSVADIEASVELKPENQHMHLTWQSDLLQLPALDLSLNKALTLTSPAPFTLTLMPESLNPLLPQKQLQLTQEIPLRGTLQNLHLPIHDIKNSLLDVVLNAGEISFSGLVPLRFPKTQALFTINTLDQIRLNIDGQIFQAALVCSYNPETTLFTLTQPLHAQYTIDPSTFKALRPSGLLLAKPSIAQLSIEPLTFSIPDMDLSKLKIKGQLSSQETLFGVQGKQIVLKNTALPFQWNAAERVGSVQLSSQVQNPSNSMGSMRGQCNLSLVSTDQSFDLSSATIEGDLDLQNLSSTLLDTFSGKPISALTGSTFNSQLKLQSSPDQQNLNMKWTSPNLNIDAGLTLDRSSLRLQDGTHRITWTLTPDGYKVLDQLLSGATSGFIPFEMNEASTFTLTASKLLLPVAPKSAVHSLMDRFSNIDIDITRLQLDATALNPKLTFFDKSSQETIQLTHLNFSANKKENHPFSLSMDSGVATQGSNAAAKNGSISLTFWLEQTLNAQKTFDLSQLTGNLQFKAQQLPSRVLDLIARAKGRTDFPFTALCGNSITTSLSIELNQFSGPVLFNMNTPLTRVHLNGTMKNGALTLTDPIHVQMKITPEMSRLVLKEVNPLNLSYIYSQEPVTLEIPVSGFYFPCYPFNLGKITMPKARIELGKIACRNEGNVHVTLGLLKLKQFEKTEDLMLWFAPLDFSVKQGSADMERTEILLADAFDICLWGNVDLVKDEIDMTLGLTAQALSKAFGIKNLPENYVLRIPMRGKADNVRIDTGKATSKIALLLAWQHAQTAGALGKGSTGALIGGLINKMATLPDSNEKVPPPKHPFPWEVGTTKSKTSHHPPVKKRQFKADEKPLKQIFKLFR